MRIAFASTYRDMALGGGKERPAPDGVPKRRVACVCGGVGGVCGVSEWA